MTRSALRKAISAILHMRPRRREHAIESLVDSINMPELKRLNDAMNAYGVTMSEAGWRLHYKALRDTKWQGYESPAYMRAGYEEQGKVIPGLKPITDDHEMER